MISDVKNIITIQSIEELISALTTEERGSFDSIIRSTQFSINEFDRYSSWCNKSYTRNCIADNEKFELILLCWEAGQKTPIHDHGGEECWVKILKGEFQETIYSADDSGKLNTIKVINSKTDDITYMVDFMGYHCLENLSTKKSMSLHLYAKPIRNCNVFDETTRKFVNKVMVYDTETELAGV